MTCSHGSGHRMVAQTLKTQYEEIGCTVEVFDIFNEYNRLLNIGMEKLYLLSYKPFISRIYGYLYYLAGQDVDKSLDHTFYSLFKDIVVNVISGFQPDLIVNTYNHRTVFLNKEEYFPEIPLVSVVTEFTLPSFWVHENNDKYYLACSQTKERLLQTGTPEEKIMVTGIPVRKNFKEKNNLQELKKKYNLDPNKKTLVIFAGTFGVLKNLNKICDGLDKIKDLQTLVICGLNKKLYNKLSKRNYKNIHVERYISDIQEIYEIGDFMVTKPGGTVLSEVVVTKMPVILYDPVPGQELENAQIFEKEGAALIANSYTEVLAQIYYLKNNDKKLTEMKKNLERMNYGDSTELIVRDSLQLIKDKAREN